MKDWLTVIVATLAIGSLLLVGGNYSLRLGTILAMYAVLAQSWNFIGGLAGYPSFATAAFFGLGAYASGILEGKGIPDARLYKTAAFVLSAIFVGFAGAIYASWVHYIEPGDVFDILLAIKPLVMVLIGGLGTLFGPLLGAAAYLLLEEVVWRNLLTVHAAVLGLLIVLLVLFLPGGIAAVGRHRKAGSA